MRESLLQGGVDGGRSHGGVDSGRELVEAEGAGRSGMWQDPGKNELLNPRVTQEGGNTSWQ